MLSFVTWLAKPDIISSVVTIRWYGVLFAIGFYIGYVIVSREFRHEGAPEKWLGSLFIYVVVATIIGARLGHVFFYEWDYYGAHPGEILKIWNGGLASHGGTIGIIVAVFIYSLAVTKRSPLWTFDRLVVPVGFVGALIRLGNLMNHEIYGHATDVPWAFSFVTNVHQWMAGAEPVMSAPSHPTQLYEAAAYIALSCLLMWMYWRRDAECRPGLIFGTFLTILFSARFLIEFVKNEQVEWEQGMALNMGQLLSIPFILLGICLIIYALRRPPEKIDFPDRFPDSSK